MKQNYQIILVKKLNEIKMLEKKPSLLLHSCCAPCSSYVLEYLTQYFNITVYYYNPNIYPEQEYNKRAEEQQKLVELMQLNINVVAEKHLADEFYSAVKGFEKEPEGGIRCQRCFELRLSKAAEYAKANNFDYFTTTLSISPLKNAEVLNSVGKQVSQKYGVEYLYSDFKKKNGYKRSCEISQQFGLYRQNYCGCVFSMQANNEL